MGHCLKSVGCWIWPVSRWSHRRVLRMKCSVTAGLTGKHEVREDVKRKGLLKSSWRLVLITLTQQWPTFPISDKQTIVLDYTLPLCNHNNTLLSSSYILFIQMVKNCYNYTCKDSWAFTCYGLREWTIRKVRCLHVRLTVKKVRHSRICPLLLPSCAQMFPDWRAAGTLVH